MSGICSILQQGRTTTIGRRRTGGSRSRKKMLTPYAFRSSCGWSLLLSLRFRAKPTERKARSRVRAFLLYTFRSVHFELNFNRIRLSYQARLLFKQSFESTAKHIRISLSFDIFKPLFIALATSRWNFFPILGPYECRGTAFLTGEANADIPQVIDKPIFRWHRVTPTGDSTRLQEIQFRY